MRRAEATIWAAMRRATDRRHTAPHRATGMWKDETVFVCGSRIGMSSLLYSGEPNSRPCALTVGSRSSEEIRSWT
jgi:hypothetical protein